MDLRLAKRMDNLNGAATREILKLTANPEIISFAGGMPGRDCFPEAEIASITDDLLTGERARNLLQYGTTDGLPSAREAMVGYVKTFGITGIDISNVIMVSGGQQALDLACKAFLNPGDVCLVENPTYLTMLQILNSYEAKAVGVDSADEGLNLDDLEAKIKSTKAKLLYIVPTFSNPTGKTYSVANRKAIAELTAKHGVIVIEDDPYSQLRFEGEKVPSLKSMGGDNVMFVSSFSKIISPGLRMGFVVGDKALVRKLEICKQGVDVHTPNLVQAIAEEFVKRGYVETHIAKVIKIYKNKKDLMCQAIDKHMPKSFRYNKTEGGLFIWGAFDGKVDTYEMFGKAVEKKVAYVYGNVFYADNGGRNTLRLNFSNADIAKIEPGIRALGEVFS